MNQLRVFFALFFLVPATLLAVETDNSWEIRGADVKINSVTGEIFGTNGVTAVSSNIVLTADSARLNSKGDEVVAEGHVIIKDRNQVWQGDRVTYNLTTHQMTASAMKSGHEPMLLSGMSLGGNAQTNFYSVTNAFVTTDDIKTPVYHVQAKRIVVVPGEYIEADGATVYLKDVPIFYYPHYRRRLGRHESNWTIDPGYRSLYGAYLLTTYNWQVTDNFDAAIHYDMRTRRGLAGGPDFRYRLGEWGDGYLRYYYAYDLDPETDLNGKTPPTNRQRLKFSHQVSITTNLTAQAVVNYQSDSTVIRDFYESEYRHDIQPKTFVEANQQWQNFSLDVLAQPRVNDFFDEVERLPDVRLTGLRQQIAETPLFYESESSVGYYERIIGTNVVTAPDVTNRFESQFSAGRFDTYHQITLPETFFRWLNFTPRVGGRFTHYTEASGTASTTSEQDRGVFNTGAEVSFKASRVWAGATNSLLDVDGIRHIIEPSFNYVYVPQPNVRPPELPQFDYELPSFRPLPIEFPDYNAIDSIDAMNVIRMGLHNKLQTKRDGQIQNLVNWDLLTDWRLSRRFDFGEQTNQTRFSDVYSDLEFRPRSWILLSSSLRYGVDQGYFREISHRITLLPDDRWTITLGQRYLHEDPALGPPPNGHNTIYDSIYCKFNENWGGRVSHFFEARDGVMEDQFYTIYRDLRSWVAALTFRVRDTHDGTADYTVALTFSLKAFPRNKLGTDTDKPWGLVGY